MLCTPGDLQLKLMVMLALDLAGALFTCRTALTLLPWQPTLKATPERHLDDLFMNEGLYTVLLLAPMVALHMYDRLRQSSG
jgi:hypothetical protein